MTNEATVDLRWALWYADPYYWDDNAPGVYDQMILAFCGMTAPIRIHTAPKKEIHFGEVTIGDGYATVEFHTHWDSPWDQIPDELPPEYHDKAVEWITSWFESHLGFCEGDASDPIGAEVRARVTAGNFPELMAKIDALDSQMREQEMDASEAFHDYLKGTVKEFTSGPVQDRAEAERDVGGDRGGDGPGGRGEDDQAGGQHQRPPNG